MNSWRVVSFGGEHMADFFDIPGGPELPTAGGGGGGGDYLPLDGSEDMEGGLVLFSMTPATAGDNTLFLDSDNDNLPTFRDGNDAYYDLTEGSTPTVILP